MSPAERGCARSRARPISALATAARKVLPTAATRCVEGDSVLNAPMSPPWPPASAKGARHLKTSIDPSVCQRPLVRPGWRAAAISSFLLGLAVLAAVMAVNPAPAAASRPADPNAERADTPGTKSPGPRSRGHRTRLASLGHDQPLAPSSLSGASVRWRASPGCLNRALHGVLQQVAASFGPVTVNSTCRSPRHNARVGGARHSQHLTGNAVDFRIAGNAGSTLAFLRSNQAVGGLKHYGGGLFHIDTGPRRTW